MPKPLRFALDVRVLGGRYTGDRTYWKNLVHALAEIDTENEYLLCSRLPLDPKELPQAPNFRALAIPAPNDRLWTLWNLPRALRSLAPNLLHLQYTAPPRFLTPCPVVTTVHDISFRLFPEWFPLKHRLLMNLTVPASMKSAARVITDSEGSRADILRVYGYAPEQVVSIPLAVSSEFALALNADPNKQEKAQQIAKEKYGISAPYLLAVGVLQPRKNLPLLAEAFGRAKAAYSLPHQLVLVGKMGWGTGREVLEAVLLRGGTQGDALHITGYVEDDDLPYLYHACEAFAHPALYEGFGLTPLEAMACGAPVLVSDATPMPEVVGDAAQLVPAQSVEAWAEAIGAVLQDANLRQSLRERGQKRVALFSWQETARRTLEVYRAAAQS